MHILDCRDTGKAVIARPGKSGYRLSHTQIFLYEHRLSHMLIVRASLGMIEAGLPLPRDHQGGVGSWFLNEGMQLLFNWAIQHQVTLSAVYRAGIDNVLADDNNMYKYSAVIQEDKISALQ